MPIYEYRCQACGHEFEAIQKMSDSALTDCPKCHKSELKKLISAAGFQLKGTGWYATDFKDSGSKKSNAGKSDTGKKEIKAANLKDKGTSATKKKSKGDH